MLNRIVLMGRLTRDPELRRTQSGTAVVSFSIACDRDYAAQGAEKVIWSVKANAQFNSDCAYLLREAFKSGRIRLLETEYTAENDLAELRGYSSLSLEERMKIQLPYIHTTLLIDELTKLQHEESGGKVRLFERTGMRKDRYSSLAYNYYVATQLETKMSRRMQNDVSSVNMFVIKPPSYGGKAVNLFARNERNRGAY